MLYKYIIYYKEWYFLLQDWKKRKLLPKDSVHKKKVWPQNKEYLNLAHNSLVNSLQPPTNLALHAAFVIRGFFICNLLIHIGKNGTKWQFSRQKWTFYLRMQDSRSKMTEHVYREKRGKPVFTFSKQLFRICFFGMK